MNYTAQVISFQVVPGPKGVAEAVQRLRSVGFEQIKCSYDGQWIQVIAHRSLVEHVLGFSLLKKEQQKRSQERAVVNWALPEGIVLPPTLQDVVADLVFPVSPTYHHASLRKNRRHTLGVR